MAPWRPEPQPIPNIDVDDVDVSPTRRLSVTSLASDITLDLIRGVPLEMCLQNFGLHFGTGQRSAVLAKTGFELSQHTNQIAAFISHDWRTSRFSKTVALLIAFNSTYAALAALLLNIMMCGLLLLDCLPGGWPTASASTYCVFYLVLCFWQRIRRCFCCRSILVFLDRLCIAQHDEDLKRRGVLGLAAFLAKSQRLVVLWSPRYFSRLWCTFEIASWLKDEEVKPVEFVPVSMAMLLWSVALLEAFLWWIFQFYVYIETDNVTLGFQGAVGVIATVLAFLLPAFLLAIPAQFYFGILHMREVLKLKSQMTSFSIREADCSCCAMNHMNPVTGEAIFCDRTLVFQTLRRWYTRTGDPDTHLDRFDALVREQLSASVLRTLGSGAPTLRYVFAMFCAAPLAQLPQYVSMGLKESRGRGMGKWLLDWCKFPALALVMFGTAFCAWRKGAVWSRAPLCAAVPALQCLVVCSVAAYWIPYEAVKLSTGDDQFFEAIPLACMWIILVLMYTRLYPSYIFGKSGSSS
ncbi:unnamed protein product [Symbiodinium natans]|uniref:Uncharacterized protein n=1 Tax=Symbiodinium natans TaxID=878477 RepID=A0A812UKD3_9DINO|nr:unnamed protein product [Symbiodinium natans]